MNAPVPPVNPINPIQSARLLLKELQNQFTVLKECSPLAIGIDKQIIARLPSIDRKALRIALGLHTKSIRYLKQLETEAVRLDLDGKPAGEVTAEQRVRASETLRERFKKQAEERRARQKEEEDQRRRDEKLKQLAEKFSGRR